MAYTPGPFDRESLYVQWGGSLPGGEQWSCGVRMANDGVASATGNLYIEGMDTQVAVDGWIKDAVLAFHQRPATLISNVAHLEFVKFNKIGLDGKYMDPTTSVHYYPAGTTGSGTGQQPANQVTLAITLLTGVSRGPAHMGRFYIPLPIAPVGNDGLISLGVADGIRDSARTFLEDLSNMPGVDSLGSPSVVVMSRKAGAPRTRQVTGVKVGRVLDTQRRRRRSLPESYESTVVDFGLL